MKIWGVVVLVNLALAMPERGRYGEELSPSATFRRHSAAMRRNAMKLLEEKNRNNLSQRSLEVEFQRRSDSVIWGKEVEPSTNHNEEDINQPEDSNQVEILAYDPRYRSFNLEDDNTETVVGREIQARSYNVKEQVKDVQLEDRNVHKTTQSQKFTIPKVNTLTQSENNRPRRDQGHSHVHRPASYPSIRTAPPQTYAPRDPYSDSVSPISPPIFSMSYRQPEIKESQHTVSNIYIFGPPEIPETYKTAPTYMYPPETKNDIVFIRTPDKPKKNPIIIPPEKRKIQVYVLSKDDQTEEEVIRLPYGKPEPPEVFHVNVKPGENPELINGISFNDVYQTL